jgi:hypothetical protein
LRLFLTVTLGVILDKDLQNEVFSRLALRSDIDEVVLCEAITRASQGSIDADLGGGVIKRRIPARVKASREDFASIVLFRKEDRAIFVYCYAKKDQANIAPEDLRDYRKLAGIMLSYSIADLSAAVACGRLLEVNCDADKKVS